MHTASRRLRRSEKLRSGSRARTGFLILFTLPTFLAFCIFVLIPIVQGLYYSFFQWNGLSTNKAFIGVANYQKLFADPIVWKALGNDLKVAFFRLVFTLVLSLGLALILTRCRVLANKFFRNVLFFPVMLSVVVICTIWMMFCNPSFGVLNAVVGLLGIDPPAAGWLGDPTSALYITIPPAVWCSVGFYMIIFISAIESIPETLFESAKLDGVSRWRETKDIILPLLRPQINFCAIYVIISSMNGSYLFVKLLTNGGPNNASEVLGTYMSLNAFSYHQFGYATTIAMLILATTLVLSAILNRVFKSEAYEF
jgi:N-acetylglucosamine transport system permease protein